MWWCDGSAQPSGWYCKYIGKRTIERLAANKEELTSWSNQSMTGLTALVKVFFTKLLTLLGHVESLLVKIIYMHKSDK